MSITIEQTVYEPVPTGRYSARIIEIAESDGQFGPQVKITFELPPDEHGETRTIYGWCSQKFSTRSKLYEWTKAALGGEPIDRIYTFDSDDLVGKKVTLSVTEENGELGIYNKISSVMPYVNQASVQVQQTQQQEEDNW
ncbi:hypothetical protein ACFLV7_00890 [Chloroflexota bacterium]